MISNVVHAGLKAWHGVLWWITFSSETGEKAEGKDTFKQRGHAVTSSAKLWERSIVGTWMGSCGDQCVGTEPWLGGDSMTQGRDPGMG
jgi:hypothetical protein